MVWNFGKFFARFGLGLTNLAQFGPIWSIMTQSGPIGSNRVQTGPTNFQIVYRRILFSQVNKFILAKKDFDEKPKF